ncbi:LysR substrate-binding domain-containing protein [Nonomuraea sp. B5E05]|uniref:LysR substrate-binding domain-containing protein n=1 Tax=Nonomuraea sp. B5E05 TaxID=3153569 RepID=UPI003260A8EB
MLSVPAMRLLHELRLRGTLTAAAEALHLSRSAASHQLAALQRGVGMPLTERVGRGLRLTEAGQVLALRAERVLNEIEAAGAAVEQLSGTVSGLVRVAFVQTLAINLLPRLLTGLAASCPLLRVEGRTAADDAVVAVASGRIDLAVVPSYDTTPLQVPEGLRAEPLFRDPVRLAVPSGHRLAGHRGPVPLAELAGERWVAGEPGTYFGQLAESLCHQAGLVPDIVHRSSDSAVVAALVAAGHGVAFIPAFADLHLHPRIAVKDVEADRAGRDIVALLRAGSTRRPAVLAILAELERHCRSDGRPDE